MSAMVVQGVTDAEREAAMDREHLIEVIAREMYETHDEAAWSDAAANRRDIYLMDAGFMVDGIARAMTEWLLAAGEVGIARKWGVAMRRIDDDAPSAVIEAPRRDMGAHLGTSAHEWVS